MKVTPSYLSIAVGLASWTALLALVNFAWPGFAALQAFLFLLFMALFATTMPVYHHLGRRFPALQKREGLLTPCRRAFFTAACVLTLVLLSVMRALSGVVFVLVGGIFVALEVYFSAFVD